MTTIRWSREIDGYRKTYIKSWTSAEVASSKLEEFFEQKKDMKEKLLRTIKKKLIN